MGHTPQAPEHRGLGGRALPPTHPSGRAGGWEGTFLPGGVVRVEIPGHRDHLEDEVIPSLADHVHHLPVADLHDILVVNLWVEGAGR